jgi:protein-S-isoprenylcysteine O-methyltransferase
MSFGNLFQIVGLVWMASELALLVFRRSDRRAQNHDAGSLLWLNITVYGSLAIAIAIEVSGVGSFRHYHLAFVWLGLFLLVAGLGLRWTAILTLRRYFTVDVAVQPGQRIVTSGIFRYLRHPSYAGTLLSFIGLALSFGNWISSVVLVVPVTLAFARRIRIEERALTEAFGSEYLEYCRTTWRLFPGV